MKCPMRFNNICADVSEECCGAECMWYVVRFSRDGAIEGCAASFVAAGTASERGANLFRIPSANAEAE